MAINGITLIVGPSIIRTTGERMSAGEVQEEIVYWNEERMMEVDMKKANNTTRQIWATSVTTNSIQFINR